MKPTNVPLYVWLSNFAFRLPGFFTYTQDPKVWRFERSGWCPVRASYGVVFRRVCGSRFLRNQRIILARCLLGRSVIPFLCRCVSTDKFQVESFFVDHFLEFYWFSQFFALVSLYGAVRLTAFELLQYTLCCRYRWGFCCCLLLGLKVEAVLFWVQNIYPLCGCLCILLGMLVRHCQNGLHFNLLFIPLTCVWSTWY